jgi:teichoic acid transport system ATP-binding protein
VAESATAATPVDEQAEEAPLGDISVLARDLHVYYRVYEDRRPRLGEIFARRFRRPGFREVKAIRGVDIVAHQGESIGLIGRNGSGKSTLLQAIAGVLPPSQGEVFARSQPSLLGVSAALQRNVSGRRNIILGGLALGMSREEIEAQVDDIIEWTGLEDFIDLPIRTYSSGMKARLHFAIATSVEPEILLVDEALSVGDEVFKERSKERIQGLLQGAGTVFVCSHSMSTITEMCSRVIWIEDGQVHLDGDADEVVKAYRQQYKKPKPKKKKKQNKARKKKQPTQTRLEMLAVREQRLMDKYGVGEGVPVVGRDDGDDDPGTSATSTGHEPATSAASTGDDPGTSGASTRNEPGTSAATASNGNGRAGQDAAAPTASAGASDQHTAPGGDADGRTTDGHVDAGATTESATKENDR